MFSQVRLGYSLKEIKTEFSKRKPKLIYINKRTPVLVVDSATVEVFYYFTKNKICYQTTITTSKKKTAENIIYNYDRDYIKISNTKWIMRVGKSKPHIEYSLGKNREHIFTWN